MPGLSFGRDDDSPLLVVQMETDASLGDILDPVPLVVGDDGHLRHIGLGRLRQVVEPLSEGLSDAAFFELRYLGEV